MNNPILPSPVQPLPPTSNLTTVQPPLPIQYTYVQSLSNTSNDGGSQGAGSSTATVAKGGIRAPSLSQSSSVVFGLGLLESLLAEGRTIAPEVYTTLRSLYEYKPPPAQGIGTGTARNASFLDGCQNCFRALRFCSLASTRLHALLS